MDEGSVKAKLLEKAAAHRKEVKRTAAYVVTTAGFHSVFFCTIFVLMLLIVLMFANAMVKKERGREKRY